MCHTHLNRVPRRLWPRCSMNKLTQFYRRSWSNLALASWKAAKAASGLARSAKTSALVFLDHTATTLATEQSYSLAKSGNSATSMPRARAARLAAGSLDGCNFSCSAKACGPCSFTSSLLKAASSVFRDSVCFAAFDFCVSAAQKIAPAMPDRMSMLPV